MTRIRSTIAAVVISLACVTTTPAVERAAWQSIASATELAVEDPAVGIKALRELLLEEPDLHAAHYNLGCLLMADHPDEAFRHFSRSTAAPIAAIERDSWLNLALIHHRQGRLDQALSAAEEAARLAPDDSEIIHTRDELRRLLLEARDQARIDAMRPRLSDDPLPPAWEAEAYDATLIGAGGNDGPYVFALGDRGLPAGLTLSADGSITGTPDRGTAGSHSLDVSVSDNELDGSSTKKLTILPPPAITGGPLPLAFVGSAYQHTLKSIGMFSATWSATGLPPGVEIIPSADGKNATLRGTPTSGGDFPISISASDAYHTVSASFDLRVDADGFAPATTQLPPATAWHGYEYRASVRGRPGTYTWSGGGEGLTITADGTISGEPERSGDLVIPFTLTRSEDGRRITGNLQLTVNPPPVVLTDEAIQLTVGRTADAELRAEGGTPALQWQLVGTPPPELSITADGKVTGIPEEPGEFTLTVAVTDRWQAHSEGTLPVQIQPAPEQYDQQQQDQDGDGEQEPESSNDGSDDQDENEGQQQGGESSGENGESGDQAGQSGQQDGDSDPSSQPESNNSPNDDSAGDGEQSGPNGSGEDSPAEESSANSMNANEGPIPENDDQSSTEANATDEAESEAERQAADAAAQAQRIDEAAAQRWLQQLPDEPSGIQLFLLPDGVKTNSTEEPW